MDAAANKFKLASFNSFTVAVIDALRDLEGAIIKRLAYLWHVEETTPRRSIGLMDVVDCASSRRDG